jgi:hypothetical protein
MRMTMPSHGPIGLRVERQTEAARTGGLESWLPSEIEAVTTSP